MCRFCLFSLFNTLQSSGKVSFNIKFSFISQTLRVPSSISNDSNSEPNLFYRSEKKCSLARIIHSGFRTVANSTKLYHEIMHIWINFSLHILIIKKIFWSLQVVLPCGFIVYTCYTRGKVITQRDYESGWNIYVRFCHLALVQSACRQ